MCASNGVPPNDDDNELTRLLTSAQESGETDLYSGKRTWLRFRAGTKLDVTTDQDEPREIHSGVMHNVSRGGIAFWTKRRLREGERAYIRQFCADDHVEWLTVRVRHCTNGIRGYLIGARFENLPPSIVHAAKTEDSADQQPVEDTAGPDMTDVSEASPPSGKHWKLFKRHRDR